MTDGVWRWTKPFDISTTGVQEIQLFVGINTATLYVQVTDLGGLQKQASMTAELFSKVCIQGQKSYQTRQLVYSSKVLCTIIGIASTKRLHISSEALWNHAFEY